MTLTTSDLTTSGSGFTKSDMAAMETRERIPRIDSSRMRSMRTFATSGVLTVGRRSNRISLDVQIHRKTDFQRRREVLIYWTARKRVLKIYFSLNLQVKNSPLIYSLYCIFYKICSGWRKRSTWNYACIGTGEELSVYFHQPKLRWMAKPRQIVIQNDGIESEHLLR